MMLESDLGADSPSLFTTAAVLDVPQWHTANLGTVKLLSYVYGSHPAESTALNGDWSKRSCVMDSIYSVIYLPSLSFMWVIACANSLKNQHFGTIFVMSKQISRHIFNLFIIFFSHLVNFSFLKSNRLVSNVNTYLYASDLFLIPVYGSWQLKSNTILL